MLGEDGLKRVGYPRHVKVPVAKMSLQGTRRFDDM